MATLLFMGCAGVELRQPAATLDLTLALPTDIVAAITAAAVRSALPFSDPMPQWNAAPALRPATGTFAIEYQQDAHGHWLPHADCRLAIRVADDVATDPAVTITEDLLRATACAARPALRIEVRGTQHGTQVHGELPPDIAAAVASALAIASDPMAGPPGLDEVNLATFVGHCLWRRGERALQDGNAGDGRALLQRAARLPDPPAPVLAHLAALTADSGDIEQARDLYFRAMITARDPMQRSWLATQWAQLQPGDKPASALRSAALERIGRHDLLGAASLLHTAQRQDPRPAADYRLLALLHRERGDTTAWACDLLATEHARGERETVAWARFVRMVPPMLAEALANLGITRATATPGR